MLAVLVPGALKIAGYLPTAYFKTLANYGFDIRMINEQKQSLEPADVSHIMEACENIGYVNLLCQKGQKGLL